MTRLRLAVVAMMAIVLLLLPAAAEAQGYPNRPVKIVVPFPPGGGGDITTRVYAAGVSEIIGQQIVVENKPGAGTNIGAEFVARSAPDGYTLLMASFGSHAVNRHLFKSLSYHPVKDFTHVAMLIRSPLYLCVKPESPFKTAGELAEWGRANPGKLTYGSAGNGSSNHITAALLTSLGKFTAVHVPYRGASELNADLLAGQLDFGLDGSVIAHHRSGKLKCIGVTSKERWPLAQDLPPIGETVPGYELMSFFAVVGPANMPADIVQKLNDAFVIVAKRPETAEKLVGNGVIPYPASLQETRRFMLDVDERWGPLVKSTGATVD